MNTTWDYTVPELECRTVRGQVQVIVLVGEAAAQESVEWINRRAVDCVRYLDSVTARLPT